MFLFKVSNWLAKLCHSIWENRPDFANWTIEHSATTNFDAVQFWFAIFYFFLYQVLNSQNAPKMSKFTQIILIIWCYKNSKFARYFRFCCTVCLLPYNEENKFLKSELHTHTLTNYEIRNIRCTYTHTHTTHI